MVQEAEEHAEGDRQLVECIESRNRLESYLYSLRTTVTDTLKAKLSADDSNLVTTTVTAALLWLDEHPAVATHSKEVFDSKREEVEGIANPILTSAYQGAGGQAGDQGEEPTVEEVSSTEP